MASLASRLTPGCGGGGPTFAPEDRFGARAGRIVFGVDEVGRGPWAGPVTAAAAWLRRDAFPPDLRASIQDSKRLSAGQRRRAADLLASRAETALGWASVAELDRLNIAEAALLAMRRAVLALCERLGHAPDHVLVDGNRLPVLPWPASALVGGDGRSLSIAAASIVAKLARDAEMARLDRRHPGYGWARNAGYGTPAHRAAIARLGLTPQHRRSFRPIREAAAGERQGTG